MLTLLVTYHDGTTDLIEVSDSRVLTNLKEEFNATSVEILNYTKQPEVPLKRGQK